MSLLVAPSILSANFLKLGEEIKDITEACADMIHIDIMDGSFVPNITFGPSFIEQIRPLSPLLFDVHLMIHNLELIETFIEAGSDIITFHYEACSSQAQIFEFINLIKSGGKKAGLSLKPGSDINLLKPFLNYIDQILVMSVQPGYSGQKFMPNVIEKIKFLFNSRENIKSNFTIAVDGGINKETGALAREAGADILIAGNYIFKHPLGYREAIKILKSS